MQNGFLQGASQNVMGLQVTSRSFKDNKESKAQFRRRASAVPNLIVLWFDCSTAGKQLWFRRRARVEPNSGFTDAS